MRSFIFLLTVTFIFTACHAGAVCGGNFTDNGDGTVRDSTTGLTWKKCLEGQTGSSCTGTATTYTWSGALALTGPDWRVPNIKELQSIVDVTRTAPAINTDCFPLLSSPTGISVWSSSHYAGDTSKAWVVNFQNGTFLNNIAQSQTQVPVYVRLVRDTQ